MASTRASPAKAAHTSPTNSKGPKARAQEQAQRSGSRGSGQRRSEAGARRKPRARCGQWGRARNEGCRGQVAVLSPAWAGVTCKHVVTRQLGLLEPGSAGAAQLAHSRTHTRLWPCMWEQHALHVLRHKLPCLPPPALAAQRAVPPTSPRPGCRSSAWRHPVLDFVVPRGKRSAAGQRSSSTRSSTTTPSSSAGPGEGSPEPRRAGKQASAGTAVPAAGTPPDKGKEAAPLQVRLPHACRAACLPGCLCQMTAGLGQGLRSCRVLLPAGRLLCGAAGPWKEGAVRAGACWHLVEVPWPGLFRHASSGPSAHTAHAMPLQLSAPRDSSPKVCTATLWCLGRPAGPALYAPSTATPLRSARPLTDSEPRCCGQGSRMDPSSSPSARGSTSVSLSTADASPTIPQPGAQPQQHPGGRQAALPGPLKPVPHPASALQPGQLSGLLRHRFQALQDPPGSRETRTPPPLGLGKGAPQQRTAPSSGAASFQPAARPMLHGAQQDRGGGRPAEAAEPRASAASPSQGPYRPNGPVMYKSRHEKFMGSMRVQNEQ